MDYTNNIYLLAQAYNCSAYGAGNYGQCAQTTTGSQASGGLLADTGYNILIPAALGVAIVIASAILLIKTLIRRKQHNS